MGIYVNPPTESKEQFLDREGVKILNLDTPIIDSQILVCLVQNSAFTVAGIAYNEKELQEFKKPTDHRKKTWYRVSKLSLKPILSEREFSILERG